MLEQVTKHVAVLIPVHNEAENIPHLYDQLHQILDHLTAYSFTLVFINDGSSDTSAQVIRDLRSKDSAVAHIEFSRNFGKEAALTAGIAHAPEHAQAIIMMDADLQHPPHIIPQLLTAWESGFEIVTTRRSYGKNPPLAKRLGSYFFYRLMDWISETEIVAKTTDFRLIDRAVIDAFQRLTERNRMVRGLIDWMGFKKTTIDFVAPDRSLGDASYSYVKLIRLAMHAVTSFSLFPLKLAGYAGVFVSFVSVVLIAIMTTDRLWLDAWKFSNLAFVVVINSLLVGLVLACLGLIALYIGAIHVEVLNRPLFIVREFLQPRAEDRKLYISSK